MPVKINFNTGDINDIMVKLEFVVKYKYFETAKNIINKIDFSKLQYHTFFIEKLLICGNNDFIKFVVDKIDSYYVFNCVFRTISKNGNFEIFSYIFENRKLLRRTDIIRLFDNTPKDKHISIINYFIKYFKKNKNDIDTYLLMFSILEWASINGELTFFQRLKNKNIFNHSVSLYVDMCNNKYRCNYYHTVKYYLFLSASNHGQIKIVDYFLNNGLKFYTIDKKDYKNLKGLIINEKILDRNDIIQLNELKMNGIVLKKDLEKNLIDYFIPEIAEIIVDYVV